MSDTPAQNSELEVHFKPDSGKAVIEGKTVVPFQSFVALILQRKVTNLFKTWSKAPVIIDSELLTSLASAPQDSQENRANLVLVTLVAGILAGVTGFALVQMGLLAVQFPLGYKELGTIVGSVFFLLILVVSMMKGQKKPKGEKLMEMMEKAAGLVGKK
jgi:hypothetical protein